jgi:hypothetical protein
MGIWDSIKYISNNRATDAIRDFRRPYIVVSSIDEVSTLIIEVVEKLVCLLLVYRSHEFLPSGETLTAADGLRLR